MNLPENFPKQFLYKLKMLFLICAAYYLLTYFTGCPVLYVTGISCPGCGMTRAWLAVLHLDFARAFACHPLFPLAPLFAAAFLFDDRIDFRKYRWLIVAVAVLFFLVYLIRIIWFRSDVIIFEPQNGLIFRIFQQIRSLFTSL